MLKITLKNIMDLGLPLDNNSKVMERGTSEKVLKRLEEKYNLKTTDVCSKSKYLGYNIYVKELYNDISEQDKNMWITNYEVYIRSSFKYKFWIGLYRFITAFEE